MKVILKFAVIVSLPLFLLVWLVAFLPTAQAKTPFPRQTNLLPVLTTTQVLYDGALGGTPDTQGLTYITQPVPPSQATQTYSNGVTILDTTAVTSDYAGYFNDPPQQFPLSRTLGYTFTFSVQLEAETHLNNNRAGFSIIALGEDVMGIELGFWADEIWAQEDDDPGPIFTHAEGVTFDTTAEITLYELAVLSDTYTLWADGIAVLTGPLRDYTAFSGTIDPYETPNLLFLGDDTTSAEARIRLRDVAITAVLGPTPLVSLSSNSYGAVEDSEVITVTVQLDSAPVLPVTVNYATGDGTAVSGSDYVATSGTLTFTNALSQQIAIPLVADGALETDETFTLTLADATNAVLADPFTAALTIFNDDTEVQPAVMFSSSAYTTTENGITAVITVMLDMPPTSPVTVTYATQDGTAVSGSDYVTSTGQLVFTNTAVLQFSVTILDDALFETSETVALTLSDPANATLGIPHTAALTITSDDAPAYVVYLPIVSSMP